MIKKILVSVLTIFTILIIIFFIFRSSTSDETEITTVVQKGQFEVLVFSSGQLEAQSSEYINIPEALIDHDVRIYEIKITDLIDEGSVVDSGDYVATLDQKTVEEEINKALDDLELDMNNLEDAKMDSNLTLSNYRDQITNAREAVEEKQIVLDESVYESPAIIRKAEMDLEKAKRVLEQQKKGYVLKERQASSRVERREIDLRNRESRLVKLRKAYNALVITAPKAGMVMYNRERNSGGKMKVGSTVYTYRPTIARLPDLSSMLSTTYINEIDISKVKVGQKVTLGVDAIPEKVLQGEVISVANVGQPMPKSDAKVFEVKIQVFSNVDDLKPSMTTSNTIQTAVYKDTLFIPSEAVFENDSLQFVYLKKDKTIKQVIDLGDQNANYILVNKGVREGDVILLNEPENADEIEIEGFDIYNEIMERKALEEEKQAETNSAGILPTKHVSKKRRIKTRS
ncbi:MAG: efflux RND transporter periplasmic adaptor subunit [Draconibacterium sp.]